MDGSVIGQLKPNHPAVFRRPLNIILTIFFGSISVSIITGWLAPNDAGQSPETEAGGENVGVFLCTGHSGRGLSVDTLIGLTEDPDNPISVTAIYNK